MWEESDKTELHPQASMVDVVFRIQCARLPVDHAAKLAAAIDNHAPQLREQAESGVHPIHVAGSQNGWERPEDENELLILSKRTRLKIRTRAGGESDLIEQLTGVTLEIASFPLVIISGQSRPITPASTLFSRHTYYENLQSDPDETRFIDRVIDQCRSLDFRPTKILCGREHYIQNNEGMQHTRSVLLADVPPLHSLKLQEHGLGDGRTIGCGLLIPHKDTGAVNTP